MGRPRGSGRLGERTSIQIPPKTRERIEEIVERDPVRHPTFSHTLRETIEIGLPVIEKEVEARESDHDELATDVPAMPQGP